MQSAADKQTGLNSPVHKYVHTHAIFRVMHDAHQQTSPVMHHLRSAVLISASSHHLVYYIAPIKDFIAVLLVQPRAAHSLHDFNPKMAPNASVASTKVQIGGEILEMPDAQGHFGCYGGQVLPPHLVEIMNEINDSYETAGCKQKPFKQNCKSSIATISEGPHRYSMQSVFRKRLVERESF